MDSTGKVLMPSLVKKSVKAVALVAAVGAVYGGNIGYYSY